MPDIKRLDELVVVIFGHGEGFLKITLCLLRHHDAQVRFGLPRFFSDGIKLSLLLFGFEHLRDEASDRDARPEGFYDIPGSWPRRIANEARNFDDTSPLVGTLWLIATVDCYWA